MNIFYSIYKHKNRISFQYYEALMKNALLTHQELESLNKNTLLSILEYAVENVPYYSKYKLEFEKNKASNDITNVISIFPIITKQEIRNNYDQFLSNTINKIQCYETTTGGSTGEPLHFWRDREYVKYGEATLLRSFSMMGYNPGDDILWIWGEDLHKGKMKKLQKAIMPLFSKRHYFNAFDVTEPKLKELISFINTKKPKYIYGYASSLYFISKWAIENNYPINIKINGIMSTAEKLHVAQRELIQEVFHAKVFDQYGSREVAGIASECQSGNLHYFTDSVYLENQSINNSKNQSLIVTNLHNKSMPLIRYEIGDIGQIQSTHCNCGSPFPIMKMDVGRISENITMPNGTIIHGEYFTHLMYNIKGISQFQFVHEKNAMELLYVKDEQFNSESKNQINSIITKVGIEIGIQIAPNSVDKIPLTNSGKHKFIVVKE